MRVREFRRLMNASYRSGLLLLVLSAACTEPTETAAEPPEGAAAAEEQLPLASLHIEGTPFEIGRPAIWEEGFAEGEGVLESWIHPQVDLFPNLNITLENPPAPGEKGAEQMLEELARKIPGFKIEAAAWQTINGITGLRSTSTWPSIYGELTALRMMIPWEGKVVLISFVDFTPSFRNNALAYNRCIDALAPFEPLEVKDPKTR